ncbi:hypothetical protein LTR97_012812 [Elasticomyces elasticus]|uniref:Uncharacterized protein n=1 Tax=Elasticomyces elasticus TaxID=574655 RepID=A0AAN7VKN2_9PEZI|nr:hypothetical protein LTR97_012812 [Elasticomyces elasticus]
MAAPNAQEELKRPQSTYSLYPLPYNKPPATMRTEPGGAGDTTDSAARGAADEMSGALPVRRSDESVALPRVTLAQDDNIVCGKTASLLCHNSETQQPAVA